MTLYYSLVFVILVVEMVFSVMLVLPMPNRVRKSMVLMVDRNPFKSQISLALKFTFVFILVLFVDSVNRVSRVQNEIDRTRHMQQALHGNSVEDSLARKFYAQRNMYLCGFTLFLSLVLNRLFSLVKIAITAVEQKGSKVSKGSSSQSELEAQLKEKDTQIAALKKQAEGLTREYNRVSDEVNKGDTTDKKKD